MIPENVMVALASSSRRFSNWIEHTRQLTARELGLHLTDFRCLGVIYDSKTPISPKKVADVLGLSTGSATALVDRLERAGLVRRVPNPKDRRGVLLVPNEEAMRRTSPVYEQLQLHFSQVLSDFSVREIETVCRVLDRVAGSEISETIGILGELKQPAKQDT